MLLAVDRVPELSAGWESVSVPGGHFLTVMAGPSGQAPQALTLGGL